MDLRLEFVKLAMQSGVNFRRLCVRFGISAPTGYKWLNRYKDSGESGLKDRKRRRKTRPLHQTSESVELELIQLRETYPQWGPRKLRKLLKSQENPPSVSTVARVLKRNGLIEESERLKRKALTSFERAKPNELWQMDYKGHFLLSNAGRCHPLTICDDHSRFNIQLKACQDEQKDTVKACLSESFLRYGLPEQILCDNGSPWGSSDSRVHLTELEVWLLRLGVEVIHGRSYHPQTQGKEERFHRTLKHELLSRRSVWRDLAHCQSEFDPWRERYNCIRPHEALNDRTPIEVYRPSERKLPANEPLATDYYDRADTLRKVRSKGEINFKNQSFTIGRGFIGEQVALKRLSDERWEVYYCWKNLGLIDLAKCKKTKNRYESLIKTKN